MPPVMLDLPSKFISRVRLSIMYIVTNDPKGGGILEVRSVYRILVCRRAHCVGLMAVAIYMLRTLLIPL